jgi:hypothetical protein
MLNKILSFKHKRLVVLMIKEGGAMLGKQFGRGLLGLLALVVIAGGNGVLRVAKAQDIGSVTAPTPYIADEAISASVNEGMTFMECSLNSLQTDDAIFQCSGQLKEPPLPTEKDAKDAMNKNCSLKTAGDYCFARTYKVFEITVGDPAGPAGRFFACVCPKKGDPKNKFYTPLPVPPIVKKMCDDLIAALDNNCAPPKVA